MALQVIPDAEALIGSWLREHDDITALGARVAGRTPDSTRAPWVRVTQLDAPRIARSPVDHALDYMVQLDCYAGTDAMSAYTGQAEASLLARTVRAVLTAMQGTVADDVAVGRVHFTTHMRRPDVEAEPARERYILIAEIVMHAA